jgi:hypothetical protein
MTMRIGGDGVPPVQPEEVGRAQRSDKAPATAGDPALTVETATPGDPQQAAAGPLTMEELLPTPDFGAQKRVLSANAPPSTGQTEQASQAGATQSSQLSTSQNETMSSKIDPNTASSNAAVAAMAAAGWAMIQSQQIAGKAEDDERKSSLHSYESEMDTEVSDIKQAAKDTWKGALAGGLMQIGGSLISMYGATGGGETGESPGPWRISGQMTGSAGGIIKGAYDHAAGIEQGKEKTAEKEAGIFQSATQNAAQHRDTYYQTQTTVIQALQTVIQQEGAAEESAASGRA